MTGSHRRPTGDDPRRRRTTRVERGADAPSTARRRRGSLLHPDPNPEPEVIADIRKELRSHFEAGNGAKPDLAPTLRRVVEVLLKPAFADHADRLYAETLGVLRESSGDPGDHMGDAFFEEAQSFFAVGKFRDAIAAYKRAYDAIYEAGDRGDIDMVLMSLVELAQTMLESEHYDGLPALLRYLHGVLPNDHQSYEDYLKTVRKLSLLLAKSNQDDALLVFWRLLTGQEGFDGPGRLRIMSDVGALMRDRAQQGDLLGWQRIFDLSLITDDWPVRNWGFALYHSAMAWAGRGERDLFQHLALGALARLPLGSNQRRNLIKRLRADLRSDHSVRGPARIKMALEFVGEESPFDDDSLDLLRELLGDLDPDSESVRDQLEQVAHAAGEAHAGRMFSSSPEDTGRNKFMLSLHGFEDELAAAYGAQDEIQRDQHLDAARGHADEAYEVSAQDSEPRAGICSRLVAMGSAFGLMDCAQFGYGELMQMPPHISFVHHARATRDMIQLAYYGGYYDELEALLVGYDDRYPYPEDASRLTERDMDHSRARCELAIHLNEFLDDYIDNLELDGLRRDGLSWDEIDERANFIIRLASWVRDHAEHLSRRLPGGVADHSRDRAEMLKVKIAGARRLVPIALIKGDVVQARARVREFEDAFSDPPAWIRDISAYRKGYEPFYLMLMARVDAAVGEHQDDRDALQRSLEQYQEAQQLFESSGVDFDREGYRVCIGRMAKVLTNQGEFQQALDIAEPLLKWYEEEYRQKGELTKALTDQYANRAFLLSQLRQYDAALQLAHKCLEWRQWLSRRRGSGVTAVDIERANQIIEDIRLAKNPPRRRTIRLGDGGLGNFDDLRPESFE